ncbi:MAG TPA: efflux RND transporter periplasmic adaptor subunit [Thermoanaerobaculia bacterium]|nr:efflux RND transporter periplasmic adaptor subunit [Thermoanaerobaculia bacterium]
MRTKTTTPFFPSLTLLFLLLAAAAISVLTGCAPAPAESAAPAATAAPAPVARPLVRTVPLVQTYPAEVEAVERVELRPRVAGSLEAVEFREGARVARGQILFRIDPRPYRAALAGAEAVLAQAEADAREAEREAGRAARLLERRALAVEETERRRAVAEAAAARVAAARAAVEQARLELGFTEVRSPIAGLIGRAEVTRGNLVGPETRLAVVVATDPVYVRFDVDENTLAARAGFPRERWKVRFTPQGAGESLPAELAFVENEIGRGTGTLRVRARLANSAGAVIPGMYGSVALTFGEEAGALLVREEAIGVDQGQRFVLAVGRGNVLEGNVLEYRPVTLGPRVDGLRVVASGLSAEDRVVVNGLFRLRPGAPVAPREVPMQINETEG